MKKLAIVSFLPLWDMKYGGTAARYATSSQYARNGYNVRYYYIHYPVMFKAQEDIINNDDSFDYITLHVKITLYNRILNFLLKLEPISRIIWKISIISKIYSGKHIIPKLFANENKPDIIYSIGSDAILATYKYASRNKIYHISRFLGTYLGGLSNKSLIKRGITYLKGFFPEVLAFKKQTDKCIISDDGTMGDIVYRYLKLNPCKLIFLRDGLDLNYRITSQTEKEDLKQKLNMSNQIILLAASRIADWKRLDRILSCIKLLYDNNKAGDIRVIILGDGPLLDSLINLNKKNNTQDIVVFAGMVSVKEVYDYLQIADLFISFQNVTNVGNNLLQAIAVGVPIMVTDSGNTRNFIAGNNIGFIFNNDDSTIAQSFDAAIEKIRKDKSILNEMRKNMVDFKRERVWSWEKRIQMEIESIEKDLMLKSSFY